MKRRYLTKYSSIESFTTARPSIENPTVCLIKGNGEKDVKFEYSWINDDEFAEELRKILGRRNINRDIVESITNNDLNKLGSYYIIDNIELDENNIGTDNVDYSNQVGTWVEINTPLINLNNEEILISLGGKDSGGGGYIDEGSIARGGSQTRGGESEPESLTLRQVVFFMNSIPAEATSYVTLNPSGKTVPENSDKQLIDQILLDRNEVSYDDIAAFLSTLCPQEFEGDDITGINVIPLMFNQNSPTLVVDYINRKTRYVMDSESNVYVQFYSTTVRNSVQRISAANLTEFKKLIGLTNFADGDWDLGWTSTTPFSSQNEVIYLPKQISYLPSMCFHGCTNLREIHLLGIDTIGNVAFGWDNKKNIQEIHFYTPIEEVGDHFPLGNNYDWAEDTPIKFIFHYKLSNGNYLIIGSIVLDEEEESGPIKGLTKGGDTEEEGKEYDPYYNFLGKNAYFYVPDDVVWETRDYYGNWPSDRILGLSALEPQPSGKDDDDTSGADPYFPPILDDEGRRSTGTSLI